MPSDLHLSYDLNELKLGVVLGLDDLKSYQWFGYGLVFVCGGFILFGLMLKCLW